MKVGQVMIGGTIQRVEQVIKLCWPRDFGYVGTTTQKEGDGSFHQVLWNKLNLLRYKLNCIFDVLYGTA